MKAILILTTLILASCSYSLEPDGKRSLVIEPESFNNFLEIISEK